MISRRSFVSWGLRAVVVARFLGADLLDAAKRISREAFGEGVPILESLVEGEWYQIMCTMGEFTEVWITDSEGNRFAGDPEFWTYREEGAFGIQIPASATVESAPLVGMRRPLPPEGCEVSMAVRQESPPEAQHIPAGGGPAPFLFPVPPAQSEPLLTIGCSVGDMRAWGAQFCGEMSDVRIEGYPDPGDLLEIRPRVAVPAIAPFPARWYEDRG